MKEMKKNEKKDMKKLKKKEQGELEQRVVKMRTSYMDFFLEKTQKGEVFKAKWKELVLGDYIGPDLPSIAIKNILQYRYKFQYLNVLVEKDFPIKNLTLY